MEIYGPESSGKTTLALNAVAAYQARYPDNPCVYVDMENSLDPKWAAKLGVDVTRLQVVEPDFAEHVVDIIEGVLSADDAGLVVLDSIAAMVTLRESEQSAEKADVGGQALVVGRLMRKACVALKRARERGNYTGLICINQIRSKIGVMYGSPETTPGGNAPKFFAAMRIRTYAKPIVIATLTKEHPAKILCSITLKKWKVPIVAARAEWDMALLRHAGLEPGEVDNWPLLEKYLRAYGLLKQIKGGWELYGEVYKTLGACRTRVVQDAELYDKARIEVTTKLMADHDLAGGEAV